MPATAKHPSLQPANATKNDFLPLNGTDFVEFYVGNARQSAYFYRAAFGMKLVAYAGPETGHARSRFVRSGAGQSAFCADHSAAP